MDSIKKHLLTFLLFLAISIGSLPFALPYEESAPPILYLFYSDHVEEFLLGSRIVIFHLGFYFSLIVWTATVGIGIDAINNWRKEIKFMST